MSCSAVVAVIVDVEETVKETPLLTPLYDAEIRTQPVIAVGGVTENVADAEPCGTVTVEGITNVAFVLARGMVIAAAGFESVTVHVVLVATMSLEEAQVRDVRVGVDHRARVADRDEPATVAVMVPVESASMLPMVAVKTFVAVPAGTTILAGTETMALFEPSFTVVSVAAGCERVAVHEAVEADITPAGEQESELTRTPVTSEMVADCEEPL